jgi:hypothetical protein
MEDFFRGLCRFVTGLGKKVLLANQLAAVRDTSFGLKSPGLGRPWRGGAVCYTLQIYYDFSGYSIWPSAWVAFRFHFLENSTTLTPPLITDVWRRCIFAVHMFREYLTFARRSRTATKRKALRNLFVVWLPPGSARRQQTFVCGGGLFCAAGVRKICRRGRAGRRGRPPVTR